MKRCVTCGHRSDYHNAFGTMPCAACDCARLRLPLPASEQPKGTPKSRRLGTEWKHFEADTKKVRKLAKEVERQAGFLLRNGQGDVIRAKWLAWDVEKLAVAAERLEARYRQWDAERGKLRRRTRE